MLHEKKSFSPLESENIRQFSKEDKEFRRTLLVCFYNIYETFEPWSKWKSKTRMEKADFNSFGIVDFTYTDSHLSCILKDIQQHLLDNLSTPATKNVLLNIIEDRIRKNQIDNPSTIVYIYSEEQDSYGRNWCEDACDRDWTAYLQMDELLDECHAFQTRNLQKQSINKNTKQRKVVSP